MRARKARDGKVNGCEMLLYVSSLAYAALSELRRSPPDAYSLQVSQLLTAKAVILRLQAGSQEAGFLAAFCPIGEVPSLVVIQ
jgi:hypothetical protein